MSLGLILLIVYAFSWGVGAGFIGGALSAYHGIRRGWIRLPEKGDIQ